MKIFEKVVETELIDGETKVKSVSLHIGKKSLKDKSNSKSVDRTENTVNGLVGGLFLAWFLSLFTFDKMVIDVIQSLFNTNSMSISFYYVGFGLIGSILGFIRK